MADLFHLCGPSLRTMQLQIDMYHSDCDLLLKLMKEHCGTLEKLSLTESIVSLKLLRVVSFHCTRINTLTFHNCKGYQNDMLEMPSGSALRTFEASDTFLPSALLNAIAVGSPLLEVLVLKGANLITQEGLQIITNNCPLQHSVSLSDSMATDEYLQSVVQSCRNLSTLEILHAGRSFTNVSFLSIARYASSLTRLRMEDCSDVAAGGLEYALKNCQELRDLSLECCISFGITSVMECVAKHCPLLTHLTIQCRNRYKGGGLTAVAEACAHLKRVTFISNSPLIHVSLQDTFAAHVEVQEVVDTTLPCKYFVSYDGYEVRGQLM